MVGDGGLGRGGNLMACYWVIGFSSKKNRVGLFTNETICIVPHSCAHLLFTFPSMFHNSPCVVFFVVFFVLICWNSLFVVGLAR